MGRDTEKALKKLHKYVEENSKGKNLNDEQIQELIDNFMKEYNENLHNDDYFNEPEFISDDYLEKAYETENEKEAIKYAKEALKYNPNNVDASSLLLDLTAKDPIDLLAKQEKLMEKTEDYLQKEGYYGEVGHFWGILETRPYMRLCQSYTMNLIRNGMMSLAIDECEMMLNLCENDNLGIRYTLMHLYAYMEELEGCKDLIKRYPEDSTSMLLPLSIAYFKIQDYTNAKKYLKKLQKGNSDTYEFFNNLINGTLDEEYSQPGYYRPNTMEEFDMCIRENAYLYLNMSSYYFWAVDVLKPKNKKSTSKYN